ncbi:MAG: nickel pincer cofactor biosynthesis protein LarC [Treponema sp.]|nr:nickel pincer cofactor biosynthesis protein LarC [Treponema sp.]
MKTLHFDCFAGISGDMTLGALVDLGVDAEYLKTELAKLNLDGWKLDFVKERRGGVTGLHAIVDLGGDTSHVADDEEHHHHHGEGHSHHHHAHDGHDTQDEHGVAHDHTPHVHRRWKDIRILITRSDIADGAKTRALDIFTRIAEAEAKVHDTPVEDVTFHEVGALDSIIDIVGAAICLDFLKPDRITCGEVELGAGVVRCAHGMLPVPAPATQLLIQGMPVTTGGFDKEMTTPTGAAILAASVNEFITTARFREARTGYGIGTRNMERPNFLRVSLREEASEAAPWKTETLTLVEAAIDDMTGEAFGFLMESLFEAGALDVTLSPCVMKKSRPGTIVSILANAERLDLVRRTLFHRSSTIGFREIDARRLYLERREETRIGEFGAARIKTSFWDGEPLRAKMEADDRARIAREKNCNLDQA